MIQSWLINVFFFVHNHSKRKKSKWHCVNLLMRSMSYAYLSESKSYRTSVKSNLLKKAIKMFFQITWVNTFSPSFESLFDISKVTLIFRIFSQFSFVSGHQRLQRHPARPADHRRSLWCQWNPAMFNNSIIEHSWADLLKFRWRWSMEEHRIGNHPIHLPRNGIPNRDIRTFPTSDSASSSIRIEIDYQRRFQKCQRTSTFGSSWQPVADTIGQRLQVRQ